MSTFGMIGNWLKEKFGNDESAPSISRPPQPILNFDQIAEHRLESHPFRWAAVDNLYAPADAQALARDYPRDHFKLVSGYGGEKDYEYEARELIGMGAKAASFAEHLSPAWLRLAQDLLSVPYRRALSQLTGIDLLDALLEVNVFHYGPGASLGPHTDLADKVVTHVLYFNETWNPDDGGCLNILSAKDMNARAALVKPIVGNSAVLVRSDDSWHAVSRVVNDCRSSRRSMTVTFYRPGSVSSMWPPNETAELHTYQGTD